MYETADAASAAVTRETLTVQTSQNRTYVVVANANGAAAGFQAALAPDGEIESQAADPAIVCYNMTMSLVAQHQQAPAGPLSLVLSFGGRAVAVPLAVEHRALPSSQIVASGRLDAVSVDARIDFQTNALSDALFEEFTYGGTPARIVARTMCSLGSATAPAASSIRT